MPDIPTDDVCVYGRDMSHVFYIRCLITVKPGASVLTNTLLARFGRLLNRRRTCVINLELDSTANNSRGFFEINKIYIVVFYETEFSLMSRNFTHDVKKWLPTGTKFAASAVPEFLGFINLT